MERPGGCTRYDCYFFHGNDHQAKQDPKTIVIHLNREGEERLEDRCKEALRAFAPFPAEPIPLTSWTYNSDSLAIHQKRVASELIVALDAANAKTHNDAFSIVEDHENGAYVLTFFSASAAGFMSTQCKDGVDPWTKAYHTQQRVFGMPNQAPTLHYVVSRTFQEQAAFSTEVARPSIVMEVNIPFDALSLDPVLMGEAITVTFREEIVKLDLIASFEDDSPALKEMMRLLELVLPVVVNAKDVEAGDTTGEADSSKFDVTQRLNLDLRIFLSYRLLPSNYEGIQQQLFRLFDNCAFLHCERAGVTSRLLAKRRTISAKEFSELVKLAPQSPNDLGAGDQMRDSWKVCDQQWRRATRGQLRFQQVYDILFPESGYAHAISRLELNDNSHQQCHFTRVFNDALCLHNQNVLLAAIRSDTCAGMPKLTSKLFDPTELSVLAKRRDTADYVRNKWLIELALQRRDSGITVRVDFPDAPHQRDQLRIAARSICLDRHRVLCLTPHLSKVVQRLADIPREVQPGDCLWVAFDAEDGSVERLTPHDVPKAIHGALGLL